MTRQTSPHRRPRHRAAPLRRPRPARRRSRWPRPASCARRRARPLKVSVGRQPWAAGNSPVTQYMIANKTFEKFARRARLRPHGRLSRLSVGAADGRGVRLGQPRLRHVGQHADRAPHRAEPAACSSLTVGEGHFRFVLATRKDSPIRNIADLKGKTVGALLGGDPVQRAGRRCCASSSATAIRRRTASRSSTRRRRRRPRRSRTGMDAAMLIHPAFLKAQAEIGTVGIMNSFGYTESHYKGPAGEGAGILLESVKKSPFYPDGYYLHRSFWISQRQDGRRSNPGVVTAFADGAAGRGGEALRDGRGRRCPSSRASTGSSIPSSARWWSRTTCCSQRGWCWPTEGDAAALLETSKYMVEGKLIPKPLAWAQVRDAFAPTAAPVQGSLGEDGPQARHRRVRGEGRQGPARRAGVGPRAVERAHDRDTQRNGVAT